MNNLKILDSIWFNNSTGTFGLVLTEDEVTGERKIFGGVASGTDQKHDEQSILSWGNKINVGMLQHLLSRVTPALPEEKGGSLAEIIDSLLEEKKCSDY